MCGICETVLKDNGMVKADVDVLIPHQANWRIIDAVGRKLEIPAERVFSNVDRYGNTSAASVPVALSEALDTEFVKKATPCLSHIRGRFHLGCSVDTVLILKHVFRCLFVATGQ